MIQWIAHLPFSGAPPRPLTAPGLDAINLPGATLMSTQKRELITLPASDIFVSYTKLQRSETSLRVEGDFLGMMPIYRHVLADGWLVSNRIGLIQSIIGCGSPSRAALLDFLVHAAPMAERTMDARIERIPAGSILDWTPHQGPSLRIEQPLQAEQPDVGRPLANVLDEMDAILMASTRARMSDELWVSLSGGYDSRLVAGLLKRCGAKLQLISLGNSHHNEIRRAREIAKRLGFPWKRMDYPSSFLNTHREHYIDWLEAQLDPYILHLARLNEAGAPFGMKLGHGFMGDPAAGSVITQVAPEAYASFDALAEGLVDRATWEPHKKVFDALGWSHWRDELVAQTRATLVETPEVYQSAILWHTLSRQRRVIAEQLTIFAQHYSLVTPFLNVDYLNFMLKQPFQGLYDRTLFRRYFAQFYPTLAEVPHPLEAAALRPRLREMLERALHDLPTTLMNSTAWTRRTLRALQAMNPRANPDVQRLSYGGETQAIRQALADEIRLLPGADVLRMCFPTHEASYAGLAVLRRLWALAQQPT
jgi:Asparagine synthase